MPIKNILTKDDLVKIAEFFMTEGYGDNITVEIELPDKDTIKRVNEDFYYRLHLNENETFNEEPEVLNINVGGVKFKYFVKEK